MPIPDPKRRWFHLSSDRFVAGLILVVCLLWLSDRFQWFGFNHHKGWTVLFGVAAVGTSLALMLLWWAVTPLFHSRFQFGIRTLLSLILVCSIVSGWLAAEMKQAQRQAETVQWIKNAGRHVGFYYDWESDANGNFGSSEQQLPEPEWLRKVLKDDFFSTVAFVAFRTKITDAGLDRINRLKQLTWLDLFNSKITDAGLRHLDDLPQLRRLDLMGAKITDTGMEDVKGLTNLRDLYLNCSWITDAGLEHLKGLVHLRLLDLDGDEITNVGVKHLEGMEHLEELYLSVTKITDAGLEHLKGLTRLQVLGLRGTKITSVGLTKLQQALPNCQLLTDVPISKSPHRR